MKLYQQVDHSGSQQDFLLFVQGNVSCRVLIVITLRNITKTCLYNVDPLKPHLYIVKLGFTGAYIIVPLPFRRKAEGHCFQLSVARGAEFLVGTLSP